MRALVLTTCLAACAFGAVPDNGPVDKSRLAAAARTAGFTVREIVVDAPAAVHPRLPFAAQAYDDPYLETLRRKYDLEKVVAPARDEWSAQLLLKEWVYKQIPGGNPRVSASRALDILEYAARGEKFYCTHYAITYSECARALGWQARKLGVDRWHGPETLGSTHHGVAEVWSNQWRKWVVMDSQSNLHFERAGVPLSGWEIRSAWVEKKTEEVRHMVGIPPHAIQKNPAIVWWKLPDEDESATYFWLYVDTGNKKFILPVDEASAGRIWYQNDYEANRSHLHRGYTDNLFVPVRDVRDAYWTVGIVEARMRTAAEGALHLTLASYLPDRAGYEMALDGGHWQAVKDERDVAWSLRAGWNSLRLRAVGPRHVTGPESTYVMYLEPAAARR